MSPERSPNIVLETGRFVQRRSTVDNVIVPTLESDAPRLNALSSIGAVGDCFSFDAFFVSVLGRDSRSAGDVLVPAKPQEGVLFGILNHSSPRFDISRLNFSRSNSNSARVERSNLPPMRRYET